MADLHRFVVYVTILSLLSLCPLETSAKKKWKDKSIGGEDAVSGTKPVLSGGDAKIDPQPKPCVVTAALVGANLATLDGLCYDDKLADRVCCKNLAVLGSTGGNGKNGVVSVSKDKCEAHQYCCLVKANAAGAGQTTVFC